MLNGIDPILIFQFYKRVNVPGMTSAEGIVIESKSNVKVPLAIVPIYLSELITGIYIDTENKNIDIASALSGLVTGDTILNQTPISSITTINMIASSESIGLTILMAISELLLDLTVSGEAEITYMHRAVTVFGGKLHGLSIDQGTSDDLYKIKLELTRGSTSKSVNVPTDPNATRLASTGATPQAGASTATSSTPQPSISPGGLHPR
jgi:hypothetical protein